MFQFFEKPIIEPYPKPVQFTCLQPVSLRSILTQAYGASCLKHYQFFLIPDVPNLNLDIDTEVFDWCLSWFLSVLPGRCRDNVSNQASDTSFHILFSKFFTNQPRYNAVVTELNKPWM
jgi:hypothetical protein